MAAKKAESISNLRQIGTTWIMYAGDSDDIAMPPRSFVSGQLYRYWWASFDGSSQKLVEEDGLLYPYSKGKGIQADPSFPNRLRAATGMTGYGYNYRYLGTGRTSLTQVGDPSNTVAFATSAQIDFGPTRQLQGNTYLEAPSAKYPTFHGRMNGVGCIVWTDSHANTRRPILRTAPFSIFAVQPFQTANLGDIDRDGDLSTDELFDLD